MVKLLGLLVVITMVLHLIKPIGLPGLRRRRDAWKIAMILIVSMMVAVVVRPG
ncbi:hypothetical protein DFR52_107180 [Hoeflea marina]|uniref:Uncharacterized protein n=1 Tax=Hoeflea marina TaxID=274592 RepID=A0A317PFA2_9HYPH|nr:hypothetical protein [Hoeflea marina]PWV97266.1 hypothetical protein DFR52_107180 [Hoeflea marina]